MKTIWIVDIATGVIKGNGTFMESDVEHNIPAGCTGVETQPANPNQIWQNEQWVDRPDRPSEYHNWNNGIWELDIESAGRNIRRIRDLLIAKTDWTQGKDIPDVVSQRYTEYRQALRDITLQPEFPANVVWPQKP
jgi:hypothetical protein